jgi:hypothetical protein
VLCSCWALSLLCSLRYINLQLVLNSAFLVCALLPMLSSPVRYSIIP